MNEVILARIAFELLIAGLQSYTALMRIQGKSEAEIKAIIESEIEKAIARDPAKLPEV
jgi:hypothetical protein